MSFTTGTALDYLDLLDRLRTYLVTTLGTWTSLAYSVGNKQATVAVVAAGGSGYAVNDTITLTGGTFTVATVLKVLTLSGSAVATVSIQTAGTYSVAPTNPVAQGSTSGSGTGATFTMTYQFIQTNTHSLSLQAPGNGSNSRVYINLDSVNDSGAGKFGWRLYGATAYTAAIPHGSQAGAGGPVHFNLSQNSISYWFFANSRRFIVVAKVSTNYMSCYGGFFLPFGLPTEYPFPLAIIASYPSLELPSVANARNSSIADPGVGAGYFRRRTGETWRSLDNQANNSAAVLPATGQRAFVWPHKTGQTQGVTTQTGNPEEWGSGGFNTMRLNINNEAPLVQAHIIDLLDVIVPGALDGVFSTTGFGRSVEQQLTYSGRAFRLFQRAFRNNPGDFFAVEEV